MTRILIKYNNYVMLILKISYLIIKLGALKILDVSHAKDLVLFPTRSPSMWNIRYCVYIHQPGWLNGILGGGWKNGASGWNGGP